MKMIFSVFMFLIPLFANAAYAEATEAHTGVTPGTVPAAPTTVVVPQNQTTFQAIQWVSKDANDPITIENGTGTPITVQITVSNRIGPKATGVNIKNCGETTHLDLGSSTICSSSDPSNPITFSSDSATDPASGTYMIKQQ